MSEENKLKEYINEEIYSFLNQFDISQYYYEKEIIEFKNNIMKIICEDIGHDIKYNKEKCLSYCDRCNWKYIGKRLKARYDSSFNL